MSSSSSLYVKINNLKLGFVLFHIKNAMNQLIESSYNENNYNALENNPIKQILRKAKINNFIYSPSATDDPDAPCFDTYVAVFALFCKKEEVGAFVSKDVKEPLAFNRHKTIRINTLCPSENHYVQEGLSKDDTFISISGSDDTQGILFIKSLAEKLTQILPTDIYFDATSLNEDDPVLIKAA